MLNHSTTHTSVRDLDSKTVSLEKLVEFSHQHPIWDNQLLLLSSAGDLTLPDYRFLFSQYHFFSKSFVRLLACFIVNCDHPNHNKIVIENCLDELGILHQTESHVAIFQSFLTKLLGSHSLDHLIKKDYTNHFIKSILDLCLYSSSFECAAILAFAVEGIVPKLYDIFKTGLLSVGLQEEDLFFFNLHISCDTTHSNAFNSIITYYSSVSDWENKCIQAIHHALSLRDTFFQSIYNDLPSSLAT